MKHKNRVWKYFDVIEENSKKIAKCKACKTVVSAKSERLTAHRLRCHGADQDTNYVGEEPQNSSPDQSESSIQGLFSTAIKRRWSNMAYQKVYMNQIHSSSLLCQLSQMWQRDILCDAVIQTGNSTTKAHRVVLVAACPMLQSMDSAAMGNTLEVKLSAQIQQGSVTEFLRYLYDGFMVLTEDNVRDIEKISRVLQVDSVTKCCTDFYKVLQVKTGQSTGQDVKFSFHADEAEFRHVRSSELFRSVQNGSEKRSADTDYDISQRKKIRVQRSQRDSESSTVSEQFEVVQVDTGQGTAKDRNLGSLAVSVASKCDPSKGNVQHVDAASVDRLSPIPDQTGSQVIPPSSHCSASRSTIDSRESCRQRYFSSYQVVKEPTGKTVIMMKKKAPSEAPKQISLIKFVRPSEPPKPASQTKHIHRSEAASLLKSILPREVPKSVSLIKSVPPPYMSQSEQFVSPFSSSAKDLAAKSVQYPHLKEIEDIKEEREVLDQIVIEPMEEDEEEAVNKLILGMNSEKADSPTVAGKDGDAEKESIENKEETRSRIPNLSSVGGTSTTTVSQEAAAAPDMSLVKVERVDVDESSNITAMSATHSEDNGTGADDDGSDTETSFLGDMGLIISNADEATSAWYKQTFKDFLTDNGEDPDYENYTDQNLDLALAMFFKTYPLSLEKLKHFGHHIVGSLNHKPNFKLAQADQSEIFKESNRVIKQLGWGLISEDMQRKGLMTQEDLNKLYESGVLSNDNPTSLQNKVWVELMIYIGGLGRQDLRSLEKDHFIFEKDERDKLYFRLDAYCMAVIKKKIRVYEQPENINCPVESLWLYLSKLNPESRVFFQQPLKENVTREDGVWYSRRPIGKNHHGVWLANICKEAGVATEYKNQALYFKSNPSSSFLLK